MARGKKTGRYRSRFEAAVCHNLECRGIPFEYEQHKFEYRMVRHYTPDLMLDNGIIIEMKGLFTGSDRTKHLLIQKQHPDLDIRFCFQCARNRLSKVSTTTYAQWCERNNFKWCESFIPQDWLDEKK